MSKSKRKRKISYLKKMVKASLMVATMLGGVGKVSASDPAVMAAVARKFPGLILTMDEIRAAGGIDAAGKKKMAENAVAEQKRLIASLTPEHFVVQAKAEAEAAVQAEITRRDVDLAAATSALAKVTTEADLHQRKARQERITRLQMHRSLDPATFTAKMAEELKALVRGEEHVPSASIEKAEDVSPARASSAKKVIYTAIYDIAPDSDAREKSKNLVSQLKRTVKSSNPANSGSSAGADSTTGVSAAGPSEGASIPASPAASDSEKNVKPSSVVKKKAHPLIVKSADDGTAAGSATGGLVTKLKKRDDGAAAGSTAGGSVVKPQAKRAGGAPLDLTAALSGTKALKKRITKFTDLSEDEERYYRNQYDVLSAEYEALKPSRENPFVRIQNLGMTVGCVDLSTNPLLDTLSISQIRSLFDELYPQHGVLVRALSEEHMHTIVFPLVGWKSIADIKEDRYKLFLRGQASVTETQRVTETAERLEELQQKCVMAYGRVVELQEKVMKFTQEKKGFVSAIKEVADLRGEVNKLSLGMATFPESVSGYLENVPSLRYTPKEQIKISLETSAAEEREAAKKTAASAPYYSNAVRLYQAFKNAYDTKPDYAAAINERLREVAINNTQMLRPLALLYGTMSSDNMNNLDFIQRTIGVPGNTALAQRFEANYSESALHPLEMMAVYDLLKTGLQHTVPRAEADAADKAITEIQIGLSHVYATPMEKIPGDLEERYHFRQNASLEIEVFLTNFERDPLRFVVFTGQASRDSFNMAERQESAALLKAARTNPKVLDDGAIEKIKGSWARRTGYEVPD